MCTNAAYICMGTHRFIVSLYFRTAEWTFTKLCRDEVLMVPYKCCCFWARSAQGRIQGWPKYVTGVPFSKELLFQTGRLQQQTEFIAMILKHEGRSTSVLLFLVPFRSQIFDAFLTSFGLSQFGVL